MRIFLILLAVTATHVTGRGQVLISLVLGDKLNSGQVEFGLDGGVGLVDIRGLHPSSSNATFNLGFYFDIKLKKAPWLLHTGVMVKSSMGAEDLAVYPLNNPDLDNIFSGGSVTRKLSYFNVPIALKYKWNNNFFAEIGPMLSLRYKCKDEFIASATSKDDITYELKIKDRYHPLDAGIIAGVGYRLMKGHGMNLAIRYYYGFVDVTIDDSTPGEYNSALYFAVGIPIGVGKMEKRKAAEAAER